MCGIAGVIHTDGVCAKRTALEAATEVLHHRGPDDSGIWLEENIGLGHRRLSILDLSSAGHQPMSSQDDRYVIVFNGEIYNFEELRNELMSVGRKFYSHSDTEVILVAYMHWGKACLDKFHGMFAFAIWDRHEKSLFAARDRMGVKPFYYARGTQGFCFASRPAALFLLNAQLERTISPQSVRYFLEAGYIPAPAAFYKNVWKLQPGHWLHLHDGSMTIRPFWDFASIEPDFSWCNRKEEHLLDELDEIITRNVASRMVSDVPLGAFLSGGIDSSLVVGIMSRLSNQPVKTFTIGFAEKEYNESEQARAVAEHLKTDHRCETLRTDDLQDLIPMFQKSYDEPFYDSSAFPTMAISKLARRHVTVSLSGDGGDELFGGYHYYQILQKMTPLYYLPAIFRHCISRILKCHPAHRYKLLSSAFAQNNIMDAFTFIRSIAKDFGSILMPDVNHQTKSIFELFQQRAEAFPACLSPMEKGMRLDLSYTLADDYLQKVDLASMAFSLESRDPLLDQDLVEWAMRLPICWKMRGGVNKYLLRKLAYRYVPESILNRPKRGFSVPIDQWLRGPLREWGKGLVESEVFGTQLPIDRRAVSALWELHQSGYRNVHPLLWALIVLADFVERTH